MLGALLAFLGGFFTEASSSLTKILFARHKIPYHFFAFLYSFFNAVIFSAILFFSGETFMLASASLPTFALRVVLEIIQLELTIRASVHADRTLFGALRVLTIPLLLGIDVLLGYTLSATQLGGMFLVVLTLGFYFLHTSFRKEGMRYALLTSLNAAVTISLFKYDTDHWNPIATEQFFITGLLAFYFFIFVLRDWWRRTLVVPPFRNLFSMLASSGMSSVLNSFAYHYGPASLILALVRASSVFWSFLSGVAYFGEAQIRRKILCCIVLVCAILLMLL